MSTKIIKFEDQRIYVTINDVSGYIFFDNAQLSKGPFTQPLTDMDFFIQASINLNDGLIEWPNGYGLALTEIEDCFREHGQAYIL